MKTVEIKRNGESLVRALNANRYFPRLRGLIGRTLHPGEGLLLTPCNGIHTFFMGYPIDAAYLDSAGRVLRVDSELRRGRFGPPARGARRVLELNAKEAERLGIRPGDMLEVSS